MKEEAAFCGPCEMYRQKRSERCEILGEYLIKNHSTVRQVAHVFGISKSTVHKDLTAVLSRVNHVLFTKVKDILEQNKQERHLRGGEATKQKYLKNRCTDVKKSYFAGKSRF